MTRGKIVLVPFPIDDFSGTKVRPAVCLTNPIGRFRHVVIAFITSVEPEDDLETDIRIAVSDDAFSSTGLRKDSVLRLHRLMTISTSLIQRELGMLPAALQDDAQQRLARLFGYKS